MLAQAYLLNEIKVGIQYVLGALVVEHTHQQCHYALYYQGIALGLKLYLTIYEVCLKPYTTLATIDKVLLGLVLNREFGLIATHIYEQLVAVHPVVKVLEFLNYLVLYFVDCHKFCI
jgi:hypothetical protein